MEKNKIDLAYIAGFFDGEGCIVINRCIGEGWIQYSLVVNITQSGRKGKQLLEKFKLNFKGQIYRKEKEQEWHRFRYVWRTALGTAAIFLKQLLPYLKMKKLQAELGIGLQENKNSPGRSYLDDEKIIKYCYFETIKQEIMFLNHY